MYDKVSTDLNFVEREKKTEKFWADHHIFEKSMEDREGCEKMCIRDRFIYGDTKKCSHTRINPVL